jgi:hypothetical protein
MIFVPRLVVQHHLTTITINPNCFAWRRATWCDTKWAAGLPDFSRYMIPKPENVPNVYTMHQNGQKISQMSGKKFKRP